ncbi:MAG: hypothetical protein Q9201_000850 [Fulgogasparrea decipioides]
MDEAFEAGDEPELPVLEEVIDSSLPFPSPPKKRQRVGKSTVLTKPFKTPLKASPSPETNAVVLPSTPRNDRKILAITSTPTVVPSTRNYSSNSLHQSRCRTSFSSPAKPSPYLDQLQKRHTALLNQLSSLRASLETTNQALEIEASTKDTELETLIQKWKITSRDAAEKVFAIMKEKVDAMGGLRAWRKQDKERANGWESELEEGKKETRGGNNHNQVELEETREGEDDIEVGKASQEEAVDEDEIAVALSILCGLTYALFENPVVRKDLTQSTTKGSPVSAAPESTEPATRWHQDGKDNGSQASTAVQEALSILQTLHSPRDRLARFEKTSGFVGTSIYYAKEAFFFLFMNSPRTDDYLQTDAHEPRLSKPLTEAVNLLQGAAKEQEPDALFLLAEMNFFGKYTHPRNYAEAFRKYSDLASLNGNSSAQHMVGFMYATGIGEAAEQDQAMALTYHTFAALGGNTKSQMTVAYRHHSGIGTPRNCNEAAYYYKLVADKAIAYARSGPPGGQTLQKDSYRIADENGGIYGEGASVVSSGVYANKAGPSSDSHAAFEDVLEYLDLMSRKGDLKATFSLGRLHYEGSRTMRRNLRTARAYFRIVVRKYWAKDGSVLTEDNGIGRVASKAAGYLGRMSLRGEGMEQSFEKALVWFKRGLANGDALCQYELGLMYLQGLGVRKDPVTAADYFKQAANQDFASAQTYLGQLFLDQGDISTAIRYFDLAARHGHIEAFYHLAEISNNGIGRERSCGVATAYYKLVAEKAESIHSAFDEANNAYDDGNSETALVNYMMAAEQGYESAQANVAYILDGHRSVLSLDALLPWKKHRDSLRNAVLALIYWTRSAKQSNIDSMVKMGDYYFGGYGIEADMEKAATCYQTAAETHQSAQALWNLGWIHENGVGVEQDFHLAKRFYDQALETNQEAYLPVKMSLVKLRMRSFWNTITHGKVNSIQLDPEPKQEWSFSEWMSNFLEDAHPYYHSADDDDLVDPSSDSMPGGDDYIDDIDESIIESLIILCLAGALAFLVYYRQQRQNNHRREMERQQQQQQQQQQQGAVSAPQPQPPGQEAPLPGQQPDGGFFPPPGDPNYGQWVAGGVGH